LFGGFAICGGRQLLAGHANDFVVCHALSLPECLKPQKHSILSTATVNYSYLLVCTRVGVKKRAVETSMPVDVRHGCYFEQGRDP
jgi:hypothetical protein